MKKPDSLRAKLVAAYPDDFGRDPQRLRMWVEDGHLRHHCHTANLNFALEYRLVVVIEGWKQSQLLIWIQLVDWLRVHQPALVTPANSATSIPFEFDPISDKECDISFELMLTEAVRVTQREDGGFDMSYVAEDDPLLPDTAPIVPDAANLASIWVDGVQLVPDDLA